jgi:hypothetical protein
MITCPPASIVCAALNCFLMASGVSMPAMSLPSIATAPDQGDPFGRRLNGEWGRPADDQRRDGEPTDGDCPARPTRENGDSKHAAILSDSPARAATCILPYRHVYSDACRCIFSITLSRRTRS